MKKFSILVMSALIVCAFQNCSEVSFTDGYGASSLSKAEGESGDDARGEIRGEGSDDASGEIRGNGNGDGSGELVQDECRKLESLEIGQEITINGEKIIVSDLTYKGDSGEGGEQIGFELSSNSNQISFLVKAGGDGFAGTGKSWTNPNGTDGPEVSAISHVDLCIGIAPEDIIDPSLSSAAIKFAD
jgi:hypothetical protein